MIWAWFLGFAAIAIALVALPHLARRLAPPLAESERDKMTAFYRDELRRVGLDEAAGRVAKAEAASLRLEAERRLLRAAEGREKPGNPGGGRAHFSIVPAAAIALLAGTGYLATGRPDYTALRPSAPDIMAAATGEEGPTIGGLVAELEGRLAEKPGDLEGWMVLANTYRGLGKFTEAARAYESALALASAPEQQAELFSRRAEAFVLMSNGLVTEAAKFDIARALAIDPSHPVARYYEGLGFFQAGRGAAGLAAWEKLYGELAPKTPWRENLRQEIETARAIMGLKGD